MIAAAVVLAIVFAMLAGFLSTLALRGWRGDIPFGASVGLPGQRVRASQLAWDRGHRAAAPYIGAAAAISVLHALACAMTLAVSSLLTVAYLVQLGGIGFLLIGLLLTLAVRIGGR